MLVSCLVQAPVDIQLLIGFIFGALVALLMCFLVVMSVAKSAGSLSSSPLPSDADSLVGGYSDIVRPR